MIVPDGLPARERLRALAVIVLGIVMAVLDGTIVNLALPDITRQLNASPAQSIWVINAYQIATLALLLPLATLGDIVGYRRVYLAGMAVFAAASVACSLADSLGTLALARAAQGLGAAGIMSVNAALVRLIYPARLLGRGIAINSMVVAAASVAGPSIAAGILSVASWPWLFAINVPFGLLCLWLGRTALPPNRARAEGARFSPLDVVLNGLMFGLVFLGIDGLGVRVESAAGSVPGTPLWLALCELGAGVAVGVVYVRRQLAEAVPLFPLDLLRIPVFALSMGTSVGAFCAQTLAYVGLPFLMLGRYGLQPSRSRPAADGLAAGHRGHGAAGGPADRPLSGRTAGRRRTGLAVAWADGTGAAAGAAFPGRHCLAHGRVRRGLWPVPVAQQPPHHHLGARAPQRRCQRHARDGAADRPDAGGGAAGHHFQLL